MASFPGFGTLAILDEAHMGSVSSHSKPAGLVPQGCLL